MICSQKGFHAIPFDGFTAETQTSHTGESSLVKIMILYQNLFSFQVLTWCRLLLIINKVKFSTFSDEKFSVFHC